jgi:hypothetical protein
MEDYECNDSTGTGVNPFSSVISSTVLYSEERGRTFITNLSKYLQDYTALHNTIQYLELLEFSFGVGSYFWNLRVGSYAIEVER